MAESKRVSRDPEYPGASDESKEATKRTGHENVARPRNELAAVDLGDGIKARGTGNIPSEAHRSRCSARNKIRPIPSPTGPASVPWKDVKGCCATPLAGRAREKEEEKEERKEDWLGGEGDRDSETRRGGRI
ncbi:hypothetical protein WN48_08333 [Eufriesea mexicana]|uniref:Uncharacterized protein n=1 Tax=Eufriesea mexicana TaxID=516756 RepID=A0A310SIY3_9HYME|nr:hypothetical protein WN48_08333 [Eufriesea mexicana]